MKAGTVLVVFLACGACAVTLGARAEEEAPRPATATPPDWEFSIAPYGWGTELVGDIDVGGVKTDFDVKFSDILDHLNIAGMLFSQLRYRRWLATVDSFYVEIETDENGQRTTAFPGLTTTAQVKAKAEQAMVDLNLGYRVFDGPIPDVRQEYVRRLALDLFLGGRYWYIKSDTDLDARVGGVGLSAHVVESADWVDPVLATRVGVDFTERLGIVLGGDIGGFGIGSASDFTWQALGLLTWRVGEHWSLEGGYRALELRRSSGSGSDKFKIDIQMRGPQLGASYRF